MGIPARYVLPDPDPAVVARMSEICDQIEDRPFGGADELLKEWHRHATRHTEHSEFKAYYESTSKADFVLAALHPVSTYDASATYAEVASIFAAVTSAELDGHEMDHYYGWLDAQFPGARLMNLAYWPDTWFDDPSLVRKPDGTFIPESNLSSDQMLAYAMIVSGRRFEDAPPAPDLPFPIPKNLASGG
ncbi:hypothetical protein [Rubripirellula reticaptiva]|uniref:Uncharacterized protein n=1 Tax=Rubripirellula reticaptiva TaxID=2528013 RepID=A0A5C6ET58_9BACT|nr:hypothetical protein [Rubripirellula reticaptiva]TWU51510.1 hypothetical protein Poly59_31020 [Rubripirellula reticaptiva]